MLPPYKNYHYERSIFPTYHEIDFEHQVKIAAWEIMSDIKVDDKYICQGCADSGKANFLCALCNERKSSNKKQESFGDPPEYLCRDCYESISAKTWDDKEKELSEEHRWDSE